MRLEFNRSFPFTMTGWRDAPATGLETGSYSDSEAPDAPERCRTNGLGTLSVRVAGETDIPCCMALLWSAYFNCTPHPRRSKKNVKNRRDRNICRGHLPRPGTSGWIWAPIRNIEDQTLAHRSPSSQGTSRRADRSRNAHRMSNRSDKSSPSRTARRRYRRMSRGEERRSLSCLGTSRGSARARSAVASQLHFFLFSAVFSSVLGTEIEGFFNLLCAHLLSLWPVDSSETKDRVSNLLRIIASSTVESATKYRMYVYLSPS